MKMLYPAAVLAVALAPSLAKADTVMNCRLHNAPMGFTFNAAKSMVTLSNGVDGKGRPITVPYRRNGNTSQYTFTAGGYQFNAQPAFTCLDRRVPGSNPVQLMNCATRNY